MRSFMKPFRLWKFVRLAAARNKAIDEDKKEYVKECRTQVKKLVEKCRESFGFQSPKEAAEAMAGAAPVVETLLDMVQKFDDFTGRQSGSGMYLILTIWSIWP